MDDNSTVSSGSPFFSRRQLLARAGGGLGMLGLASLMQSAGLLSTAGAATSADRREQPRSADEDEGRQAGSGSGEADQSRAGASRGREEGRGISGIAPSPDGEGADQERE